MGYCDVRVIFTRVVCLSAYADFEAFDKRSTTALLVNKITDCPRCCAVGLGDGSGLRVPRRPSARQLEDSMGDPNRSPGVPSELILGVTVCRFPGIGKCVTNPGVRRSPPPAKGCRCGRFSIRLAFPSA